MDTTSPGQSRDAPVRPWAWLHRALMADYNAWATTYWLLVVTLGLAAVGYSLVQVLALQAGDLGQVAVGVALAALAGLFPVRVPRSRNAFAAGEVFVFLLLLLYGPFAAVLAAAAEGLVGAWRSTQRWASRIVSPAMAALAMLAVGSVLQAMLGSLPRPGAGSATTLIAAAMLAGLAYFVCITLLVTTLPRLRRNERLRPRSLLGVFGWVGIAYAGSAAVAALLMLVYMQSGAGVLVSILPLILLLLATLHYYFGQQEAAAVALRSEEAARQREAALAARHMVELQASERRFHSAFTHASIGMALLSVDGRILQANAALRELLGEIDGQARQPHFHEFVAVADVPGLAYQLAGVHESGFEAFALELRCRRRDGSEVWASAHCSFFTEAGASAPCLILQVQDIDARLRAQAQLQHLAFHDNLTGLPNRGRFADLLHHAVERARADATQRFAVLYLDLDRFKMVNDSLGHGAGDDFLRQVAGRIQAQLRPGDTVARLGGDEFAVLALQVADDADAVALAERLLQALQLPLVVAGNELGSSASIGITSSSIGYITPNEVLRDADIAMYRAKSAGKARYAVFDAGLHAESMQRMRLEGALRRAVQGGELAVQYQPVFDLGDDRLVGFEALARWTHPEFGEVAPQRFIAAAEDCGLIVPLTDFVLHRACQQLHEWQQIDPGFAGLTMHVNVSGRDLGQAGLVARVTHALVQARLQPQHLTLELTENILMERLETALPALEALRALGIGLSVDDFGTGYSSLARLAALPIDSLKVDGSFVRGLEIGSSESTIVRAIVHLGHSLGKAVVAEGIETAPQLAQLREMGCRFGQGHHLSRPLDAAEVALLLETLRRGGDPGAALPWGDRPPLVH
jgi:diguanylate cyclase (GGDEF)-like protein/PAS domain S-box-containing protein